MEQFFRDAWNLTVQKWEFAIKYWWVSVILLGIYAVCVTLYYLYTDVWRRR